MSVWERRCVVMPSLISVADMCNLEKSVRALEAAGIEAIHIDLLDGHFSPSMPLGLDAVRALRKVTALPFDAHLMSTNNDYFVDELLDIGVDQLVFHAETEPHIERRIARIHAAGVRAGVALKPATPLTVLDYVLEECDAVLLMLINPGYASSRAEGQVPYAARKIADLRELIRARGADARVILDGRISRQNMMDYGASGLADCFVAGSTCLKRDALQESCGDLLRFREALLRGDIP